MDLNYTLKRCRCTILPKDDKHWQLHVNGGYQNLVFAKNKKKAHRKARRYLKMQED